ncbi:MAG: tetratricopeptide repeat protein [Magnetovibrio sp.]|nr:tetratricopeptide repeat protein [Magnetovibrio sp.]
MTPRKKPPALSKKALSALQKAEVEAYVKTGFALQKCGKLDAAIESFCRALDLSPEPQKAKCLEWLAQTYLRNNQMDKAEDAFRQVIGYDSTNSQAYLFLSAIHRNRGEYNEARKLMVKGIGLRPDVSPHSKQPADPRPRILSLRGVENAYYLLGLSRNGQRKLKIRGGNFTSRYFVDKSRFDVANFMVLGDNLEQMNDCPPFAAVLNAIADPDVEGASLKSVMAYLRHHPQTPVINHPKSVLRTSRDENYRRFNAIEGVIFPLTIRLIVDEQFIKDPAGRAADLGFEYPILVRDTGTQTGRTFAKIEQADQFCTDIRGRAGREVYLIQFIKTRFHEHYYRKMRAFFIDGKIYPVVCHIDKMWNVHGSNRTDVMLENPWMMDEEKAYMADPRAHLGDKAYGILEQLNKIAQLDFCGVDFTLRGDGTFQIYELNPAMRHSFDHARKFPYLQPYYTVISRAFSDMIERKISG